MVTLAQRFLLSTAYFSVAFNRNIFFLSAQKKIVLFYVNKIIITKYDLLVRDIATFIGHLQATVKCNGVPGFFFISFM